MSRGVCSCKITINLSSLELLRIWEEMIIFRVFSWIEQKEKEEGNGKKEAKRGSSVRCALCDECADKNSVNFFFFSQSCLFSSGVFRFFVLYFFDWGGEFILRDERRNTRQRTRAKDGEMKSNRDPTDRSWWEKEIDERKTSEIENNIKNSSQSWHRVKEPSSLFHWWNEIETSGSFFILSHSFHLSSFHLSSNTVQKRLLENTHTCCPKQ